MPEIPYVSEITKATRGLSLPSFAYSPPSYTDSECINYIRYLPENLMIHEHGIYLSATDSEELKFMRALLKNYHYLADWLEYFILKDSKKINLFSCSKRQNYKPVADLSLARMRLIQEVCLFIPWRNSETISINRWWFACEWQDCLNLFSASGFTGNPSLTGGRTNYDLVKAQNKAQNSSYTPNTETTVFKATPIQTLRGLAELIYKHEKNYSFKAHFDYYKRLENRAARSLWMSNLNPVFLNNGQFCLMERGKPRQKRIMK